mmetsp:Transcript_17854/g.54605  ORF Transcript_17854/g.54605 Transcript_17854/m.54605 type:complete len:93 (-) Transcript_17854:1827-2105(-)
MENGKWNRQSTTTTNTESYRTTTNMAANPSRLEPATYGDAVIQAFRQPFVLGVHSRSRTSLAHCYAGVDLVESAAAGPLAAAHAPVVSDGFW